MLFSSTTVAAHGVRCVLRAVLVIVSVLAATCAQATGSAQVTANAPTIDGAPPTVVTAGQTYVFQPNASYPDGARLVFRIDNKPSWLRLESATGLLYGTPEPGDAGIYANIVVSATDGNAQVSLPAFSIFVARPPDWAGARAPSSVSLSWEPPTVNSDGSPLTDLAGYRIYFGFSADNLRGHVDVENPGVMRDVLEGLSPGNYYIAVAALNIQGTEGELSNIITATVGPPFGP